MMLRLLIMAPWPIGLAACAVLAPMSKATAANIGNADFMRLISLSKNCGSSPDMWRAFEVWMRRLTPGSVACTTLLP
jgi:hypothetical protein